MNIFYLDTNPARAADYHCDKHVVKMCLEYAQILSTANPEQPGYKPTHQHHPCVLWAKASKSHYQWLWQLWLNTLKEYSLRFHKVHASSRFLNPLGILPQIELLPFKAPPQCMPEIYKHPDCVQAYRNYYLGEKARFATWKLQTPEWWTKEVGK